MKEHHETINQLIERSSLGTPHARAARASVPRTVAQRLVVASTNASYVRRDALGQHRPGKPENTPTKTTECEG